MHRKRKHSVGRKQKGHPRAGFPFKRTDPSRCPICPFVYSLRGHPLAKAHSEPKPSGFNTEGCRGGVALVRAPPPAPVRLDQFGNRARTGGQDEWRVPFVQYPIYDRSCHTSQSAHCNLCGNDQTSTHAVLKWSGVAAALVNPLYLDISRTTMPHRLSV